MKRIIIGSFVVLSVILLDPSFLYARPPRQVTPKNRFRTIEDHLRLRDAKGGGGKNALRDRNDIKGKDNIEQQKRLTDETLRQSKNAQEQQERSLQQKERMLDQKKRTLENQRRIQEQNERNQEQMQRMREQQQRMRQDRLRRNNIRR